MKISLRHLHWLLTMLAFLAAILVIISIIYDRSYHTFSSLGSAAAAFGGVLSICNGFIDLRKEHEAGLNANWYQNSYIRFGILLLVLAIINFLRGRLF